MPASNAFLPAAVLLAALAIMPAPVQSVALGSPPEPVSGSTSATAPAPAGVVLADGPGGLEVISAPATVPITVGHVAYLPVEVQNYHRPITVSAQTLIHTYVNDATAVQPGESPPFVAAHLEAAQSELKLQTLRMRAHPLTLAFSAQDGDPVTMTLTLVPAIQPRTVLFGLHCQPFYDGPPAPFIQVWGPDCGPCPTTAGIRPAAPATSSVRGSKIPAAATRSRRSSIPGSTPVPARRFPRCSATPPSSCAAWADGVRSRSSPGSTCGTGWTGSSTASRPRSATTRPCSPASYTATSAG